MGSGEGKEGHEMQERGELRKVQEGRRRVPTRMISVLLLGVLVVLSMTGWWLYFGIKKSIEHERGQNLRDFAVVAAGAFRNHDLSTLLPGNEQLYLSVWIRGVLASYSTQSGMRNAFIMDKTNHILADARKSVPVGTTCDILKIGEEELAGVWNGNAAFSAPYEDPSDGKRYTVAYAPVTNIEGVVVGILGVEGPLLRDVGAERQPALWVGALSLAAVVCLGFVLIRRA